MLRFPIREQITFSKRLAMILNSGVAIREGLLMLDSGGSPSVKYILERITDDVSRGISLANALASFEQLVGAFTVNIVRVGETSGMLPGNLAYLSEELKKKETLRKKVFGALIYPAIIVFATVGISLVLTVYIFPKITPIFQGFKKQLPLSTRILIGISNFLIHDGLLLACLVIIAGIGCVFLLRMSRPRHVADFVILTLPIIGRLSRSYNLANITRTMSLLLKGDVPIVQTLEIISNSIGNTVYRDDLVRITDEVRRGKKLSLQMQTCGDRFPSLCTQMISVGEETGDLANSLMYVSEMYEEDINELTKNLATLIEPVLMIVMGVIVGFIAISIITPIYGITQDLTPH
jgi:type II secretory pathway component PulF